MQLRPSGRNGEQLRSSIGLVNYSVMRDMYLNENRCLVNFVVLMGLLAS